MVSVFLGLVGMFSPFVCLSITLSYSYHHPSTTPPSTIHSATVKVRTARCAQCLWPARHDYLNDPPVDPRLATMRPTSSFYMNLGTGRPDAATFR